MIRAAHVVLGGLVVSLMASTGLVAPAAVSATPTAAPAARAGWVPPEGVAFSNPLAANHRVLQARVIRAVNESAEDETVQIAVWNLDDRPSVNALMNAKARGVNVQVVVAASVDNPGFKRLARRLNHNKEDDSFAVQCHGGCRSRSKIMHSKFYLFSRVHKAETISMFGSSNMTTPAGNRQWNDLVTTYNPDLYAYLGKTFEEYSKDKAVDKAYDVHTAGRFRTTLYPVGKRNPQLDELEKVRCRGTTGGTGNGAHRTVIRMAVAGWFDDYGQAIANRVRQLWDAGCDIRIITTLAGRGINQTFRNPRGRGPVPIRKLTVDRNHDDIPEAYLHMKAMSISGVYDGNTASSVVFTGSPNWSSRAARSEELWVRIMDAPGMTGKYERWITRWFSSPTSHTKLSTPAELRTALAGGADGADGADGSLGRRAQTTPDWLELD